MAGQRRLRGSCNCGRNHYVVLIPEDAMNDALVHFATDDEHRRSQAALLTAFLRVPLSWYQSQTIAFFPDETHNLISRTFSPLHSTSTQRKFCGYCGTHLSYWTETPQEEQGYIHVTLGSLQGQDLEQLEHLDLLPEDQNGSRQDEATNPSTSSDGNLAAQRSEDENSSLTRSTRHGQSGSLTWFEEMLDGSQMGRTHQTRRGIGTSADGNTTVQWEISEHTEGDDDTTGGGEEQAASSQRGKRKLADVSDADTPMRG